MDTEFRQNGPPHSGGVELRQVPPFLPMVSFYAAFLVAGAFQAQRGYPALHMLSDGDSISFMLKAKQKTGVVAQ